MNPNSCKIICPQNLIKKEPIDEIERSTPSDDIQVCGKKTYAILLLTAAYINHCNLSIIAPFYPAEANKRELSETVIGSVFAIYSLSMFMFSLPSGKMILKLGAKRVFIVGYILSGICSISFGALGLINNAFIFAALSVIIRFIEGFGVCVAESAILVLMSMMYPNSGNYYRSLFETVYGVGLCMGPAIGGLLFDLGGFGLPFYTTGSIIIVNVIVIAYVVPYCHYTEEKTSKISMKKTLLLPNTIVCCVIGIVGCINFSVLYPTLEEHLRKFQLSPIMLGMVFLVQPVFYALFCPLFGWLIDKFNIPRNIMLIGLLLDSVVLLFLGPSLFVPIIEDTIWLNIISLGGIGTFSAMIIVATYQGILDGISNAEYDDQEATHSAVSSVYFIYFSLGITIGSAIGGAIMDYWNFAALSSFAAIASFSTFLISSVYFCLQKQKVDHNIGCSIISSTSKEIIL